MICGYCDKTITTTIKYYFDERFFVNNSNKQIPFCNVECSTKWKGWQLNWKNSNVKVVNWKNISALKAVSNE